jgi:pimeloyl-ACP methyl ester carboxylesterase
VVGHAFGNRVARMLATDRPELVSAVGLVAANIGKAPSPPVVRAAIRNSADASLSDEDRVKALQFAFFAPGNDPRAWLDGWYPEVLAAERVAGDRTSREEDFAGGTAPILYLQPDHDPLAHVEDAKAYKAQFGDRVTVVVIPDASHAVIAEQPDAVADALITREGFGRVGKIACCEISSVARCTGDFAHALPCRRVDAWANARNAVRPHKMPRRAFTHPTGPGRP